MHYYLKSRFVQRFLRYIEANDINASGQVAGLFYSDSDPGDPHAFITGLNGAGITDLGTFGGVESGAYGINDAGQVVGYAYGGWAHAFITGPNGTGVTNLGSLGSDYAFAYGVNDAGQVVGRSGDYGHEHAFITGSQGVGMTDLDTLTGSQSFAEAINEAGQVVGYFETADGPHAFVTGPNGEGIADLNSLVNLPEDIRLDTAVAINNHGQVVAYGVSVIPERKPYVMLLAGLGFVGLAVRRRFYRSLQSPA